MTTQRSKASPVPRNNHRSPLIPTDSHLRPLLSALICSTALLLTLPITLYGQNPFRQRLDEEREWYSRYDDMQAPAVGSSDSVFTVLGRWAWGPCEAVDAQGNYAYIGNGPTFHVLDISVPESPRIVGEYLTTGYVFDIHVRDSLAFVATGGSLLILDVSDPSSPIRVSSISVQNQIARIALVDSFAYVSGFPGGVFVIDVADPSNPRACDYFYPGDEFPAFVGARGRHIYSGGNEVSELSVLDATNPDSLVWGYADIGGFVTGGYVKDTLMFLGVSSYGLPLRYFLKIFSVASPDTLVLLGSMETGKNVRSVRANDSTAYLGLWNGEILAVEIADPTHPKTTSRLSPTSAVLFGGRAMAISEGEVLTAQFSGLQISDPSQGDSLRRISFTPTGGWARKIFLHNNFAFVASGYSGLWIVDVSNTEQPRSVANINVGGFCSDVLVCDTLAYFVNYAEIYTDYDARGLWIADISDISFPRILSHHAGIVRYPPAILRPNSIAKMGDLIVLTQVGYVSDDSTLELIDVSNPLEPARVSVYHAQYYPNDVAIKDSIAYVAQADSGLRIIDLHDPWNPRQLSLSLVDARSVVLKDSFAFVLAPPLSVVNIADPKFPFLVDTTAITAGGFGVEDAVIEGHYLYWAGRRLGVADISNPENPIPRATFLGKEGAFGVAARNDTVLFADDQVGIWILRNTLVTAGIEARNEPMPSEYQLYQNYPNPFNSQTSIEFSVPRRGRVKVTLFDVLGQRVATLADRDVYPGTHKVIFDATPYSSGLYFYTLESDGLFLSKKLVVIK